MTRRIPFKALATGLFSGLIAALLMTLVMAALRYSFGVASTFEMIGDRIAPLIPLEPFLSLQGILGGYNKMKQTGVAGAIAGQIAAGGLGGVLYALIARRSGVRRGVLFVAGLVGVAWLLTLAGLWPVLDTNFRGSPPGTARLITALALLFAYALFGLALVLIHRFILGREPSGRAAPEGPRRVGRRAFLAGAVGAVAALGSVELFRRLFGQATFSYDGTTYGGPSIQPLTPNDRFYTVTKNVVDPRVDVAAWRLEVNGLVDNPTTYDFEQVSSMPKVEQETTLSCISNPVGGRLMSNAMWTGVPLRTLLEEAGPQEGVVEAVFHGVDGYTDTIAFDKAMDETTLVAYGMNGDPLPQVHGFPARMIVPGLFGEKNVKWVTRIELVDHDAKGFYETQGWGPSFVQPTRSRFDGPNLNQPFPAGKTIPLIGVAYAGDRDIQKVEVSTDDGKTWKKARIDYQGNRLSWSLWGYDWRPERPGEYKLSVRATDGNGDVQSDEGGRSVRSGEGAVGIQKITARIEA